MKALLFVCLLLILTFVSRTGCAAESKAAPPGKQAASGRFSDSVTGMQFVPAPGGCFLMGDNSDLADSDEKPVHEVCLSDFLIGAYEVTQGQWKKVMGTNPSRFAGCGDDCPVDQVSWDDAQQFITRLNRLSGKNYRLPTEAEWEYACRSGGRNEKYCGSNTTPDHVAWHKELSNGKSQRIGQKQPNGLGIYDMGGNVWEWVNDCYRDTYYAESPRNNPQGPSCSDRRVLRGGSWYYAVTYTRSTGRTGFYPSSRVTDYGFRLALSAEQDVDSRNQP